MRSSNDYKKKRIANNGQNMSCRRMPFGMSDLLIYKSSNYLGFFLPK